MKKLCFLNSVNFWGGGEKLHLEYALAFKSKGYDVMILSNPDAPLYQKTIDHGIEVHPIKVGNLSFLNKLKVSNLKKFLINHEIDTIIFSTSQDLKLGSIAANKAGVNKIVYLRGLAAPIKGSSINKYIFKECLTHIVANSHETKRLILQNLESSIDQKKLHTIYHGIETKRQETIQGLPEIEQLKKGVVLGNAGRLTIQKGQDKLIAVAKELKARGLDFSLFIAGTGELENDLKASIEQNDLSDCVHLLGFVKDMDAFMASLDIFVLSSSWEGFGYVIVEAFFQSKPVIAFDITSNPEIITDGTTGLLAEYPNVIDFADKCQELIKNENLRIQMGKDGKQSVIDRFDINERIDEFEACLLS